MTDDEQLSFGDDELEVARAVPALRRVRFHVREEPAPAADGLVPVTFPDGSPLIVDGRPVRAPVGTRVIPVASLRELAEAPAPATDLWPWRSPTLL